jgi:hypothetical protein
MASEQDRLTPWEPTQELRFAVPDRTTTEAPKLQQQHVRLRVSVPYGAVLERQLAWFDVPRVVITGASDGQ